jgi:iron(III) transport system substrate-binding protein
MTQAQETAAMTAFPLRAAAAALAIGLAPAAARAEGADLAQLIAAARAEPPITVYDSTGKIADMARAFSAKYGVKATGQKVSANSQLEMLLRESRSGNVKGDVALLTDTPAVIGQLLPAGVVESYLPADLADTIPASYRDPLAITSNANVWAYNTEAHGTTCPVANVWELTEPAWKGRVALIDPLTKGTYTDWFNQLARHGNAPLAAAYQARYGKALVPEQATAAAEWLAALARNAPLLAENDDRISDAVGAPGQTAPFFGLMSSAKFRDVVDKGYKLGLCRTLEPWVGWTYTKLALIAKGTRSPNAARLFVRYVLSEDGLMPQLKDGKLPTSTAIAIPSDEPSGIAGVLARLFRYDATSGLDDWEKRQDWQDFWQVHYRR